jgi:putative flippase GtrA
LDDRQFTRFIIAGAVNTGVTYVIYLGLALFLPYTVAYTITTIIGIFLSYALNALFVFRRELALSAALQYPTVYLVQYIMGLILLYLLVEKARMSKFLAPLLIVVVTVPITYLLSRYVISGRKAGQRPGRERQGR